jgi:copper chaperone
MTTIHKAVTGMTCEMCVRHVREALEDLDGVEQAKVDLQKKEAFVTYDESKVSITDMQKAVKNAGYDLE